MPNVIFSCAAENDLRYFLQARALVFSIRELGGSLSEERVVVNFIDDVDDRFRRELAALDAEVRVAPRVRIGPPPANKLRMLELETRDPEVLIALDCDTVVVGDLADLVNDRIRAKIADTARASAEWRSKVYASVGLELPSERVEPTVGGDAKPPVYNSGVVFVPAALRETLRDAWVAEIERLDAAVRRHPSLMNPRTRFFVEQYCFAHSIHRHDLPFELLPVEANFPTHVRVAEHLVPDPLEPRVLHYHRAVDFAGLLARPETAAACGAVDRVNRVLAGRFGLPYDGLREPAAPSPPPLYRRPMRSMRRIARRLKEAWS